MRPRLSEQPNPSIGSTVAAQAKSGSPAIFLGLTALLSWGVVGLYLLARLISAGFPAPNGASPVFLLATCAPSFAALILVAFNRGIKGVLELLGGVAQPFPIRWAVVATVAVPLVALGACKFEHRNFLTPIVAATPLMLLNIPAWGEEFGWRGFLLPRLLSRFNVYLSSALLGAVRVLWHIPAFFFSGMMTATWGEFGWWALSSMSLTYLMTALYLRSNRNILNAGIIPHTTVNALGAIRVWKDSPFAACGLLLLALIILAISPTKQNATGSPR